MQLAVTMMKVTMTFENKYIENTLSKMHRKN